MKPKIELGKVRDFGEIINDTFTFIRQNLKQLVTCFFTFCGIFLVGGFISTVMQQMRISQTISSINGYGTETATGEMTKLSLIGIESALMMLFILLSYITMIVMVMAYINLYKSKGNVPPNVTEVWGYIKYFFWRVLGVSFLIALVFGIIFGLFIAFGYKERSVSTIIFGVIVIMGVSIWLYPVLSIMFPVIVLENTSIIYAVRHSFNLVRDNWWITFGTLFVIALITGICAGIATVPASIANVVGLLINVKSQDNSVLTLVLLSFSSMFRQLATIFYIIPLVTSALCYFNLTEVKEGTSMLSRISNFGHTDATDHHATPEEY